MQRFMVGIGRPQLWMLAAALPPAVQLVIVFFNLHNLPYLPDDIASFHRFFNNYFEATSAADIWRAFVEPWSEHRLVFNRVVCLMIYGVMGVFDMRPVIVLNFAALVVIYFQLIKIFELNRWPERLVLSLLFFHLQYYHLTFWPMAGLSHFYQNIFALAAFTACANKKNVPAAVLAILATFTNGNGILVPVLCLLHMLYYQKNKRDTVWMLPLTGLVVYIYLLDFFSERANGDLNAIFMEDPLQTLHFFLLLAGSAFNFKGLALPVGILSVGIAVWLSVYKKFPQRYPAAFLFLVSLFLTLVLVAVRRVNNPLIMALEARYKIYSLMWLLGLLFISAKELPGYFRQRLRWPAITLSVVFCAAVSIINYKHLERMYLQKQQDLYSNLYLYYVVDYHIIQPKIEFLKAVKNGYFKVPKKEITSLKLPPDLIEYIREDNK